jgi:hypothetical protein
MLMRCVGTVQKVGLLDYVQSEGRMAGAGAS